SVDAMFIALYDDDYRITGAAARTLVQLSKKRINLLERILDTLHSIFPNMDWRTQNSVMEAFAGLSEKQGQQSVIDFLLFWLSDGNFPVQHAAIRALERVGKGEARVIKSLLSAFLDADRFMRSEVTRVLGSLGENHPQVIDALFQALSNRNEDVMYS